MASLEKPLPSTRPAARFRSSLSPASERRPRMRPRFVCLSSKIEYQHWALAVVAFFLVVLLYQAFLPSSPVADRSPGRLSASALVGTAGVGDLDFGDGIKFVPQMLFELEREKQEEANSSALASRRRVKRFQLRKPKLALVVPDLSPDALQLKMVSIAVALKECGYDIQVFSFSDGPAHMVWRAMGIFIVIFPSILNPGANIDWFEYSAILVSSMEASPIFSSLLQEPFKYIPVIWNIEEASVAFHLNVYSSEVQLHFVNDWKQDFARATAVVFPTHSLLIPYSAFDMGNHIVIPGSPAEAWEADTFLARYKGQLLKESLGYMPEDFLITVIGSQFSYSGMLLEHGLVLEALKPLLQQFLSSNTSYSLMKVCIYGWNFTSSYKKAVEAIAQKAGYSSSLVEHIVISDDPKYLGSANLVIYGSFLEEQSFPSILKHAMCLGKLIVAPDLDMIRKYVDDQVNGYLFPKENIHMLTQILLNAISKGKLSLFAQRIASVGKSHARNLMAAEAIQGYISLLEKVITFPSDVLYPKAVEQIPLRLMEQWQWELFANVSEEGLLNSSSRSSTFLKNLVEKWNNSHTNNSAHSYADADGTWNPIDWEEEKKTEMMIAEDRLEELDRDDQPHGTWDEIYKYVKKAERLKNELIQSKERDHRELERTGQPLCIYEPYFGEATWPFLHQTSLYRGISLSSKGQRLETDDIDASSRLPLLSNPYYRDALGDYGAFFALAYLIDSVHKNAWIGFQSWRVSARKASLSREAETALIRAIEEEIHGDSLYFWFAIDKDPRNSEKMDFWTFCDAINAGNCRTAVIEAFRRMYGLGDDWNHLPLMPDDGDSWSIMHSWALPTPSFLEFVMFSRMFVDALDREMYEEHHRSGYCYLSTSKDRHCYSRLLELLVNVWAYHSARRLIYVDPESGSMQEHHRLENRRNKMWIKWFSYSTLKGMDEDLAEEADSDPPNWRWLWPATGEVFGQGVHDREMIMRQSEKERKKRETKEKIQRMKKRARQKSIGKYIKPLHDKTSDSNASKTV
ncbi:uncharacterized protein LOC122044982 [Zingiber officinale]|uniref:uncharacterized protein LOC122044982 n=1 Tax=Zingiber officinale TaxID=94328 RepID=UPI001C4A9B67|nr:uncharacterized protein LOC122044982 [Zingiber officinale]